MKTNAVFRAITFALGLGCIGSVALAEEPATADPGAASAPPPAAQVTAPEAPEAPKARVFSLSIDADSKEDGEGSHGVRITVDGDEERGEVAGKVIGRVVDDLEAALAGLPEEVRKDVDAGDIEELREAVRELRELRELREVREERVVVHTPEDSNVMEALAPVLSILLIFGGPILIVAIVSYNNRRKRQMVHETIDRVIAQGKDVPVELLDALDKPRNGKSPLARGSVNIAIGVALGAMLFALAGPDVATIGLIPLCIGLAQLLVWKLEGRPAA